MIASITPTRPARPLVMGGLCLSITVACVLLPAFLLTLYPSQLLNPMRSSQYVWHLTWSMAAATYLLIDGVTMQIAVTAIVRRDSGKLWQWARYQTGGLLGLFFVFGVPTASFWKLIL